MLILYGCLVCCSVCVEKSMHRAIVLCQSQPSADESQYGLSAPSILFVAVRAARVGPAGGEFRAITGNVGGNNSASSLIKSEPTEPE